MGEAAIMLALRGMTGTAAGRAEGAGAAWTCPTTARVVTVEVNALNGFVDINGPRWNRWLRCLPWPAGSRPAAAALAQATVQARQQPDATGQPLRFEAIEDLMRRGSITTSMLDCACSLPPTRWDRARSTRRPPRRRLLAVLADGNLARAAALSNARLQGAPTMDTSTLHADFIDGGVGTRYRMQASRAHGDGSLWRGFAHR